MTLKGSSTVALILVSLLAAGAGRHATGAAKPRLTLQLGHSGHVESVAFSPDGRRLATGSADGTAKLWEVATGRLLATLEGHSDWVRSVAFTRDGRTLATGSDDKTAMLWDLATGKALATLEGEGAFRSVAFTPDGRTLATSSGDEATLWKVATGKRLSILKGHTNSVWSVAFSPDGRTLATGSWDETTKLWAVGTGKLLATLAGNPQKVDSVAFSPDGRTLATGSGEIWEVATGTLLSRFDPGSFEAGANSVEFSPDGRTLATASSAESGDRTARLWEVATGKLIGTLEGHTDMIMSVSFSPDGRTLATGGDLSARLWEVATAKLVTTFEGHTDSVELVVLSPDGRMLAAVIANKATLWEAATGKRLATLEGHTKWVASIAFSPDGRTLVTGSADGTAKVWEIASGKLLASLEGHADGIKVAAFSPDGRMLATGSRDHTAKLWLVAERRPVATLEGHTDAVRSIAFSPDGRTLVTGSDDLSAKVWEVATGKLLATLEGHTNNVTSVAFSPDGHTVATAGDPSPALWKAATGKRLATLDGHTDAVNSVAFSADGRTLATGSWDKTTRLWEVATGKLLVSLEGHTDVVNSVAFSANGRTLATGSWDKTTRLWEVATGRQRSSLEGHAGVESVAFSQDGRTLVTGNHDGTVNVWSHPHAALLCTLADFSDGSWAVVDPAGRFDSSNGGNVAGLHFVVGLESLALGQLKERYYDPGLLAKHLGYNPEPLRDVTAFEKVKLFPEVEVELPPPGGTKLNLKLENRGGGIGRVQVFVNGKELVADARGPKPAPDAAKAKVAVDLAGAPLLPGQRNEIRVVAWNGAGYLSSRGAVALWTPPAGAIPAPPEIYAIVGGISSYSSKSLDLRFAAKDAEDMSAALSLAAKRLFGAEKVHLTLLASPGKERVNAPTKANFRAAFEKARAAKPGDVLFVYLAGHGVALAGAKEDYCYVTQAATSADPTALADPAVREQVCITSEELVEWAKRSPALKQVMVLDTCAAGAAGAKLVDKRVVSGTQVRALERLKDRTGFHVLMGSAADAVSYEATRYSQGLLTYALLEGMKGASLREGEFVDVSQLFQYAADRVKDLARDIGGIQRPEIMAPRGTSFDIGALLAEDKDRIVLAVVKPLVVRPRMQNADTLIDDLKLEAALRARLREVGAAQPRGESRHIFVDVGEDELPGAVVPSGQYRVEGSAVTVRLVLSRDGKKVADLDVTGTKEDPQGLAAKIYEALVRSLPEA